MSLLQISVRLLLIVVVAADLPDQMKPDDPTIDPGDTLVLNCTLPDKLKAAGHSVEDIVFSRTGIDISNEHVTYIDQRTAQLRLPDVPVTYNQNLFQCKVDTKPIGFQILTVKQKPVVPNITECIVKDLSMRCTWSPKATEQHKKMKLKVSDTLTFKLRDVASSEWTRCPQQADGACTWPPGSFTKDAVYLLRIETKHLHIHVFGNYTIDSSTIIQVARIPDIMVTHLSTTSVLVEWLPVEETHPIIYRIHFSQNAIGYENQTHQVEENSIRLDGLTPYQPYEFTLEAKTKHNGFWSEPLSTSFFSMSDVPAKHPEVWTGGFITSEKDKHVEFTVYWQPIEVRYEHGPGFHYNIECMEIGDCDMSCTITEKTSNHVRGILPKNCTADITVISVNQNGTARTERTPVRIEPSSYRISGPENVTLIASDDESVVTVRWNRNANDSETTGYTLYWATRNFDSEAIIHWISLHPDTNLVELTLHDGSPAEKLEKYEFAVSREEGTRSSGIVLSDCTFKTGSLSPPPEKFGISKTVEPKYGQLSLEWKPPQCSYHRGYIYAYELRYCKTTEDDCSDSGLDEEQSTIVSSTETSFALSGLAEDERYCITITSLTEKGPSAAPSAPQCAIVPAPWLKPGYIVGFAIGGICVLLLVIFGIVKFGSHCHRLYSKFQRGLRVELPKTTYSTQFSVSSHKELIDQNNSFSYNVEDFSSPGLAKQHSQDSTADSGRGSMSHDHMQGQVRRSNSGESDEVFMGRNNLHVNGPHRVRQASEVMGGYARVTHNTEPDMSTGRSASMVAPSPGGRPKLPARNIPLDSSNHPGSMSSLPQHYNTSSIGNGSIPSYVMVGGTATSQTGDYSIIDGASTTAGSINSSPISDYTRAKGATPSPGYMPSEEQEYVKDPGMAGAVPLCYIASPEVPNQGLPDGCYVAASKAPTTQGVTDGYLTKSQLPSPPQGYVSNADISDSTLGYVTNPEAPFPSGVTNNPVEPETPSAYVTNPSTVNQSPVLNQKIPDDTSMPSYVTSEAFTGPPGDLSNTCMNPSGYVTRPDQCDQLGYVSSPNVAKQQAGSHHEQLRGVQPDSGYVILPPEADPNHIQQPALSTNNTGNSVARADAAPLLGNTPAGPALAMGVNSDYVQNDGTPPLAMSSPQILDDTSIKGPQGVAALVAPPSSNDSQVADLNKQSTAKPHIQRELVDPSSSSSAYVPFPPTTDLPRSSLRAMHSSSPIKGLPSNRDEQGSDANHNDVAYVQVGDINVNDSALETLSSTKETDPHSDVGDNADDETSFLLPSNGGHRVLNKSGYVVVNT